VRHLYYQLGTTYENALENKCTPVYILVRIKTMMCGTQKKK